MFNIKVDFKNARVFEKNVMNYAKLVSDIHNELHSKADDENELCGWLNLPTEYNKVEFERIKMPRKKFKQIQMFC